MKLLVSITFVVLVAIDGIETAFVYAIEGRNYYVSTPDRYNWFESNEFCNFNGMYLIDIPTYFEHLRMIEMIDVAVAKYNITSAKSQFWTSGTSDFRPFTDQYYWVTTGRMLLWEFWDNGYPKLHAQDQFQENYSIAYIGGSKWRNLKGSQSFFFICREKIGPPSISLDFNKTKDK